jgi:hypothetical protein
MASTYCQLILLISERSEDDGKCSTLQTIRLPTVRSCSDLEPPFVSLAVQPTYRTFSGKLGVSQPEKRQLITSLVFILWQFATRM